MQKIPTLFKRGIEDRKHVTPHVNPGCEWVLEGEGVATRKYDGTCVLFMEDRWFARREVKPDKTEPPNYVLVNVDDVTGKKQGWEPIEQTSYYKAFQDALDLGVVSYTGWEPGTYELVGPKVNGNPEGFDRHRLVRHDYAERLAAIIDDYTSAREYMHLLMGKGWEGIVWHHPDGRMVKLKTRDFDWS